MIIQNVKTFKFNETLQSEYIYNKDGIIVKLNLEKVPEDNRIITEIPGTMKISLRFAKKEIVNQNSRDRGECLFQITDKNGFAPIIDIELYFVSDEHPEWNKQKLSLPLNLYDICKKDLWIICTHTHFRLVYDEKVINEDLTYGNLAKPTENTVYTDKNIIRNIEFSDKISKINFGIEKITLDKTPICYTPFGHNTFIGDVMNFYHDGVYHMMYMPDTHHHSNRWGCGGHHFEHMITRDFITWEDVGAIWDITDQWQTAGTGTMFFFNGKYYVSFGLHTDRMKSPDKNVRQEMMEFFKNNNETEILTYDEIFKSGKYPIGTSYSESDDGIHFKLSNKIVNFEDNPSVYEKDGKLIMFTGGNVWESTAPDKPWKIIRKGFPPTNDEAEMLCTGECPSYFEWNGYKYLIMGFTGFWKTEKNREEFIDSAALGYDIYDGLAVPMAVRTDDNRVILAGWLGGIGWGSAVVHRELIQFEDGNLGSRWLPEIMPKTKLLKDFSNEDFSYDINDEKVSYYIELNLEKNNSEKFAVKFLDDSGLGCELQLDFKSKRAQFADNNDTEKMCESILPLHEAMPEIKKRNKKYGWGNNTDYENLHCRGRNFSIANVQYSNNVKIRILVHYDTKMDTSVIDAEIDGQRTLITNRADLNIKKIKSVQTENLNVLSSKIYFADI